MRRNDVRELLKKSEQMQRWLSEPPKGDDKPLDSPWLMSIGFVRNKCDVFCFQDIFLTRWDTGWRMQVGGWDGMWKSFPGRRRHLRLLLSAFADEQP